MLRKISFWLIWVGLISYAFIFAPPNQPDTLKLITHLSIGRWEGINPLIITLFNLMGIWPMIYACLLLIDGKGQKVRAWPFVTASFAVGAFTILPYLALRKSNPYFIDKKDSFIKLIDSRWLGLIITLATVVLLIFGLSKGNWTDFIYQWQTSKFIHVMSLDFCLLCILFPTVLGDDLARRGIKNPLIFWIVALIPLLGASVYLCLRPSLPETQSEAI